IDAGSVAHSLVAWSVQVSLIVACGSWTEIVLVAECRPLFGGSKVQPPWMVQLVAHASPSAHFTLGSVAGSGGGWSGLAGRCGSSIPTKWYLTGAGCGEVTTSALTASTLTVTGTTTGAENVFPEITSGDSTRVSWGDGPGSPELAMQRPKLLHAGS